MLPPAQSAWAVCASLVKGEVAFDVAKCGRLNPEKTFPTNVGRFSFIGDLPAKDRQEFYNSYRGLIVTGKVARSFAVRSGLSSEQGVLNGDQITVFIPPGQTQCPKIINKRLKAFLDEACCEGGGDPPCLLNSTYVLKNVDVIGKKNSAAGYQLQMQLERNPKYRKALQAYRNGQFKTTARLLSGIKQKGKLDARGLFYLASSLRRLDRCPAALKVLEPLSEAFSSGQYWSQNDHFLRQGVFLKARCLSKQKKAGEATIVLEAFLLSPKRYENEIRASLSHEDFGWIHTTKAYKTYKAKALKALQATD